MTETWTFHYENANIRGTASITVPLRSTTAAAKAEIAKLYPGCSISRLNCLGDDQPPIAAEADTEYQTRIQAAQVSWQFTDALRPRKPQAAVEDLPLFGGERQEDLF